MKRLFRFLTCVSLVLLALLILLWVRSYWRADHLRYVIGDVEVDDDHGPIVMGKWRFIHSERGGIQIADRDVTTLLGLPGLNYRSGPARSYVDIPIYSWEGSVDRVGFDLGGFLVQITDGEWRVIVPHWFLAAVTALLPSIAYFQRRRRRQRLSKNLCPVCGYDLRATPDRCPECGTAAATG